MDACIGTWLGRCTDCGCVGAFGYYSVWADADSNVNSGERDERALCRVDRAGRKDLSVQNCLKGHTSLWPLTLTVNHREFAGQAVSKYAA